MLFSKTIHSNTLYQQKTIYKIIFFKCRTRQSKVQKLISKLLILIETAAWVKKRNLKYCSCNYWITIHLCVSMPMVFKTFCCNTELGTSYNLLIKKHPNKTNIFSYISNYLLKHLFWCFSIQNVYYMLFSKTFMCAHSYMFGMAYSSMFWVNRFPNLSFQYCQHP